MTYIIASSVIVKINTQSDRLRSLNPNHDLVSTESIENSR